MGGYIGRLGLACLALALLPGCPPGREGASGPLDPASIRVAAGTGGLWEPGRWSRVLVTAKTTERVFRGEVEIQGRATDGRTSPERFVSRFEASIEKQTVEVPVLARDWEKLVVVFRGAGAPEAPVELGLEATVGHGARVLGIGGNQSSSGPLVPYLKEVFKIEDGAVALGWLPADKLPVHFLAYDSADLVILQRSTLSEADPERLAALREWVERGGTLVAVPGPEWSAAVPQPVLDLFGLASPPRPLDEASRPPERPPGLVFAVDPQPSARLLHDGTLLENRVGSGRAFLFTFAPAGGLLETAVDGSPRPVLLAAPWESLLRGAARGFRTVSSGAAAALELEAVQSLVAFRYPPRFAVLCFVLAYLGVGFFLAGFVFRRKNRLEWMYLFAFLLSIAASVGIYRFGLLSAITELGIDAVTVATQRSGSDVADATSFVGIASPDRRTVRADITRGAAGKVIVSQPALSEEDRGPRMGPSRGAREPLPLAYRFEGGSLAPPDVFLYANSRRSLRFDYPVDLRGAVKAEIVMDAQGAPELKVANSTRSALELYFLENGRVEQLGRVGTGESGQFLIRGGSPVWVAGTMPKTESIKAALFQTLAGSRCLVAQTESPLLPTGSLGPVRRSMDYIVVDLDG